MSPHTLWSLLLAADRRLSWSLCSLTFPKTLNCFFPNNEKLNFIHLDTFSMWLTFVFGHHACSCSYPNAEHEMDPSKNCALPDSDSIHSKAWQMSRNDIWIYVCLPTQPPFHKWYQSWGASECSLLGRSRTKPLLTNHNKWIYQFKLKQTSIGNTQLRKTETAAVPWLMLVLTLLHFPTIRFCLCQSFTAPSQSVRHHRPWNNVWEALRLRLTHTKLVNLFWTNRDIERPAAKAEPCSWNLSDPGVCLLCQREVPGHGRHFHTWLH